MVVDCATFSVETTCDPVSSSDFTKVMVARNAVLADYGVTWLDWGPISREDGWLIDLI